eukprot:3646514-Prymnesium_polylepis.1
MPRVPCAAALRTTVPRAARRALRFAPRARLSAASPHAHPPTVRWRPSGPLARWQRPSSARSARSSTRSSRSSTGGCSSEECCASTSSARPGSSPPTVSSRIGRTLHRPNARTPNAERWTLKPNPLPNLEPGLLATPSLGLTPTSFSPARALAGRTPTISRWAGAGRGRHRLGGSRTWTAAAARTQRGVPQQSRNLALGWSRGGRHRLGGSRTWTAAAARTQSPSTPRRPPLSVRALACARGLLAGLNGKADPYVMVHAGEHKRQSKVVRASRNPEFNEVRAVAAPPPPPNTPGRAPARSAGRTGWALGAHARGCGWRGARAWWRAFTRRAWRARGLSGHHLRG